jgi:hypothetical protein
MTPCLFQNESLIAKFIVYIRGAIFRIVPNI